MLSPQPAAGDQEGAKVDCLMAQKILEKALSKFPGGGKEHKAVLQSISTLAKAFGKEEDKTAELMPAEIKQMLASLAGPGGSQKPPTPPPGAAPPGAAPPPGAM